MVKLLRFFGDFYLAIGAGLNLAAEMCEPYVPHVYIQAPEEN